MNKPYRLGIVGGMGPQAGVYLQDLIVRGTPASSDQEHIEVVCFTNPHIPDRTRSLHQDGGTQYLAALQKSVQVLERAQVTEIVIACNTAHARLPELQSTTSVPILDMIALTMKTVTKQYGEAATVGLLATDGTIRENVYTRLQKRVRFRLVVPEPKVQQEVMRTIYAIKAGNIVGTVAAIEKYITDLQKQGADSVVLGCTEFSLLYETLLEQGFPVVDPLHSVAEHIVMRAFGSEVIYSKQTTAQALLPSNDNL